MSLRRLLKPAFLQPLKKVVLRNNPAGTIRRSSRNSNPSNPSLINSKQGEEKFVLIDSDAGIDDAWAIFMSLTAQRNPSNPGFNVLGITTVCGNTFVDNVTNNVTRTLDTVNDKTTPIYRGMENVLTSKFEFLDDPPYYGVDGFGDANLPPVTTRIQSEKAVDAIIRLSETYRGRLTIMCLGPLTNLAMAIKLRPEIKNNIKEIFILGGNIDGQGNSTMTAEYNFLVDPEAAKIVLEDFSPCPIIILPWETVKKYTTFTYEFRMETLANLGTPEIELLNKIEAKILEENKESWIVPVDPLLSACIINPNIILRKQDFYCTVELHGSLTRGMMVVDKGLITNKPTNATIILEVDKTLYASMLITAVGG